MVRSRRSTLLPTGLAALAAAGSLAGCGGSGDRQDADEPAGTYEVEVVRASFPERQRLAGRSELRIEVRNGDRRTVPNLAVTITSDGQKGPMGGFAAASAQSGLAASAKPTWIVDRGPRGGDTAYVGTWALGPLRPGQQRSFVWRVTAVAPGTHTIRWRVAAGLDGRAKAQTASGDEAAGTFRVDVADTAPSSRVDPRTGDVVRDGGGSG